MSAFDFLARAVEFLPDDDGPQFIEIRLHHASIAIELATKAAILHGGGTLAECLHARHDLNVCIATARAYGFDATFGATDAASTLTPYYKTHSLSQFARTLGAATSNILCVGAAEHVAQVGAWMQDHRSSDNKRKV